MIQEYRHAAIAIAVLVVVGISGWAGYRVREAECLERELEVANAYLKNQNAAVDAVRVKSEAAESNAAAFQKKRNAALSRIKELERELAGLPRRPNGDFTADELRALTNIHQQYFSGNTGGVSDGVRRSAAAGESSAGVRSPDVRMGEYMQNSP